MESLVKRLFLLAVVVAAFAPSNPVVTGIRLRHDLATTGSVAVALSAEDLSAVPNNGKATKTSTDDLQQSIPETVTKLKTDYGNLPRWLQIVLCVVAILIGLVEVFAGYHFFRSSIFVITGGLVGVILFSILDHSITDATANKAAIVYGVSVGVGLLAGAIAVCLLRPAVFLVGAAAGVLLAIFLNPIVLQYVWPEQPEANLYIWMAVFGVVFGVLVLILERVLVIAATAAGGSFLVIVGIGEIVGNLPDFNMKFQKRQSIPPEVWGYLGGWIALFIIGFLVQILVTASNEDHSTRPGSKKSGKVKQ